MKLVNDQALDANGVKHLWKRILDLVHGSTPTKVSELENDKGYLSVGVTSFNGSTGDVNVTIPTRTSQLQNDSGFVTASESAGYTKSETDALLNGKQNTLVSSVNIKTINNESILGAGDITIQGGGTSAFIAEYGVTTYADVKAAYDEDAVIICTVDDSGNTVVLQLAYFDDANDTFCFTQPVSEGSYWVNISSNDTWNDGYFLFASTDTATQLSDGLMSALDWQKLDGIESGAEVNVQSDWNQTTTTAKDYIKNKPTIPAAQVNADWNASSGVAQILNKPTLTTVTFRQW